MSNHQQHYKKKPMGFASTSDGRVVRTVRHEERRKNHRAANFDRHRDIPDAQENGEPGAKLSDKEIRLRRWKADRDIKRRIETQKKKPAFKVGVVHHKFYSPPVTNRNSVKEMPCHTRGVYKVKHNPTPEKRITRATQRRLDAKLAGASVTPAAATTNRQRGNRARNVKKRLPSITNETRFSFAPENHTFKAPAGVEEIPLFGRYVIPTAAKLATLAAADTNKYDLKDLNEKPWPAANPPKTDAITARISPEAPSRSNSSIESVTLRLSSGDEGAEDKNAAAKPLDVPSTKITATNTINMASEPDIPKAIEKSDELELAKLGELEIETSTPPRSGTPIPASFSPYIVTSRGKDSARKEQKQKMNMSRGSLSNEIPTKETIMQSLNISVEEEERTARYFKYLLEREIERLTELCDKWLATMNEPELTEDARYRINQAVGQTRLLMRKKFERFRRLVLDCETGKGEMLVQCRDLQGFWDLIYMEVKDCESRFLKLESLRSKGWIEEQQQQQQQQIPVADNKRVVNKKKVAHSNNKPKISGKSAARSWILAARKKKMSQEDNQDQDVVIVVNNAEIEASNDRTSKILNSPSLSRISTPPRDCQDQGRVTPSASSKKTPSSLLKKVQLSQALKSVRSPLAIMKISKTYKTPEIMLDDTITYVNSDQTPGKGILKKSEDSDDQDACTPKSARKVDFVDDNVIVDDEIFVDDKVIVDDEIFVDDKVIADADEVFVDDDDVTDDKEISEALENSMDLGRALAKIDSYDADYCDDDVAAVDDCTKVRGGAEKRLDFEDESFDETVNTRTAEYAAVVAAVPQQPEVPIINVIPETPIKSPAKIVEITRSNARSSRRPSKYRTPRKDDSKPAGSTDIDVATEIPLESRETEAEADVSSKSNRRATRRASKDHNREKVVPEPSAPPDICVIPETPLKSPLKNVEISAKSRRRSSRQASKDVEASVEDNERQGSKLGARVLRNRTVKPETPSKNKRRSVKLSATLNLDISLDSSTKENSDPLRGSKKPTKNSEESADVVTELTTSENKTRRRRSTRQSVRSNLDDRATSTPEPTLPLTPHSRRSRKISLLPESSRVSVVPLACGDLISFETP